MKKILSLLVLMCLSCMGAWAQNFTSVSTTKTTSAHSGFYVLDVCDQQNDDNHHYLRDGAQNTATTGSFGTDSSLPAISDDTFKKYVWYVSPYSNGTYTFRNLGTGKYLNIATGSSNEQALSLTSTMYGVHFDFSGDYAALGNGNNQWYDAAHSGTGTTTWSGGVGGSRRIRVFKVERPDYDVNFDKLDTKDTDRSLNSVTIGETTIQRSGEASLMYHDQYETSTFTITEGTTGIQPNFAVTGSWQHGMVYIDTDGDNQFSVEELVANSALTGNPNLATGFSTFNAPAVGTYRIRFKTDWVGDGGTDNGKDPGGRLGNNGTWGATNDNSIKTNRGMIIDMKLVVEASTEPVTDLLDALNTYKESITPYIGEGLGKFTANEAFNTALATANSMTESNTASEIIAAKNTLESAFNALPINQPTTGKYYRIHGMNSDKYLDAAVTSATNNKTDRVGMSNNSTASSTIWYLDNNKCLKSATAGWYITATCDKNGTESNAARYVFEKSESSLGRYYIYSSVNNTNNVFYDNGTSHNCADRQGLGRIDQTQNWVIEEVAPEYLPVAITLTYNAGEHSWATPSMAFLGDNIANMVESGTYNVDFYTNFAFASENASVTAEGQNFTINCEEDFPFTASVATRIQSRGDGHQNQDFYNGETYPQYGSTGFDPNTNLWVFEHVTNTADFFTVKNVATGKYLTFQSGTRQDGVLVETPSDSGDHTSYLRVRKSTFNHGTSNVAFCLQHPNVPACCYGPHLTNLGGWPDPYGETSALSNDQNCLIALAPTSYSTNLAATDGTDYYGSIYLPYTMTLPAGVEAYAAAQDGEVLKLTKVGEAGDVVPEGAYILYGGTSVTSAVLALGADATVSAGSNALEGRFEANVALPAGTNYVLNDKGGVVGFYKYTKNTFPVAKAVFNVAEGASNAFTFRFEDVVTAIDAIHSNNGNAEIFDLQGRRLTKAQKGMNIINGHKVLVK